MMVFPRASTQLILAGDLGFAYDVEREIAAVHHVIEELDALANNES